MAIASTYKALPDAIEVRSIDYVPERERHGGLLSQFTLWLAANLQITAIVTGALAVVFGGDVFWSLIGLFLGQLLGGAVAGLCPLTEADLGDGIFPARSYMDGGGRWGIGTDSHISLDAAAELRQLEYSQRLALLSRNLLADAERPSIGRSLFESALRGGAQALGQAVGAIAPGHRADFLVLDESHPDLVGRRDDAILDTWQFVVGRSLIRSVIAGGQLVVESHRHRARERINADYRRVMDRLLAGA